MKIFGDLLNAVAENLQLSSSEQYMKIQAQRRMNQAYQEVWDSQEWPQLLDGPVTVTMAVNANTFVLPKKYSFITRAYDPATLAEIQVLDFNSWADQSRLDQSPSSANVVQLSKKGLVGVAVQLASAQPVKIVSTNSADTAISVFLKGEDSGGNVIAESVTTNGTTVVVSANTYASITSISKSGQSAGAIQLYMNDGTTLMADIGQFQKSPIYPLYIANFTANAASSPSGYSINCVCKRAFTPLIHTLDTAFADLDEFLIYRTSELCWIEHRNPEQAQMWAGKATAAMSKLVGREIQQAQDVELMVPSCRA